MGQNDAWWDTIYSKELSDEYGTEWYLMGHDLR